MNEIWKDIKGYEGLYQISNFGRIKRIVFINGKYTIIKEKNKNFQIDKDGYERVVLSKNGKCKKYSVHRLVAETFIPNPQNKPWVLHRKAVKNGGKNSVENLYWGTPKENTQDCINDNNFNVYRYWLNKKRPKTLNAKEIIQYNLNGEYIKTWVSCNAASRQLKISSGNINQCCHNKRNNAGGYIWKFKKGE